MAVERLEIEMDLQTGQVVGQFKKIEDAGRKTASSIGNSFKDLFLANISAQAVIGAFNQIKNSITGVFAKGIQEAIGQENAINKLNIALAQSGIYSQEASRDLQNFASSLQATTTFSDDAVLGVSSLIQQIGRLDKETLKQATKASLDLATALGIDVETASRLVAKSAVGSEEALKKYGITVKEGSTNSETFANALKKINDQFGGASEGAIKTFGGAVEQLKNNFGELFEEIGNLVIKSPAVITTINFISQSFLKLSESLSEIRGNKDLMKPIILGMIDFAIAIDKYMVQPAKLILNVFTFVFDLVKIKLQQLLSGSLGALSKFFGFLGEKFDVFKGISAGLDTAFESSKVVLSNFQSEASSSLNAVGEQFTTTFGEEKKSQVTGFFESMRSQIEATNFTVDNFKNNTAVALVETSKVMEDVAKQIAQTFKQGIVDVIAEGMVRVGAALKNGASAFTGFLDAVLNIVGDMAINIGKTLIGIGIGVEALKDSLLTLSGGAAIAAGFALIALGGLIKSFAGGSLAGSAKSATSSGGGIGTDQTRRTGIAEPDTIEQKDKKTSVQLVVNGDVLDSDETGTRIVKLLNDAFENRGTVLTGARFA